MKKLIPVLFLLFALQAPGQNTDKLDKDKGIFNIGLLTEVDTSFRSIFDDPFVYYPTFEYAMLESNYTYLGSDMPVAGGFKARKLFLATYNNLITEIKIIFPFDSAVINYFIDSYGKPTLPFRTADYEGSKARWTIAIWQGRDVRLVYTAKKFNDVKDSEKAEVPDYIYVKLTSVQSEQMMRQNEDK